MTAFAVPLILILLGGVSMLFLPDLEKTGKTHTVEITEPKVSTDTIPVIIVISFIIVLLLYVFRGR